jgi:hypothetical protein
VDRRLIIAVIATAAITSVISVSLSRVVAAPATDAQAAGIIGPSQPVAQRPPCRPKLDCQVNDIWSAVIRHPLHFRIVQGTGTGGNGGSASSRAFCPQGWHVLSGGFYNGGDVSLIASAPFPALLGRGEGWYVNARLGGQGGVVQASAVCVGS